MRVERLLDQSWERALDRFRYDDSDIHLSYARSRRLPERALRVCSPRVTRQVQ